MDQARPVRPGPRSGSHRGATPALATPGPLATTGSRAREAAAPAPASHTGDAESTGDPDSPGPGSSFPRLPNRNDRRTDSRRETLAGLVFDQPLGIIGGFLLGLLTLVVPLTGVVMDRHLLPSRVEASDLPFRPVAAAENPENPGPGKMAPDR